MAPPPKVSDKTAKEKTVHLDQPDGGPEDAAWWTADEATIGPRMVSVAQKYEVAGSSRREQTRRYTQLHKGQLMSSSMYDAARAREHIEDIHPCWNVVQAAVNTEQSVVTRNRVRIALDTNGADWELQEDVKDAELFIGGVFARNKLYEEIDPVWFMDADVAGLGAVIAEANKDGNVTLDRMIPDEMVFGDVEAIKGPPAQFFRCQWKPKWLAIRDHGDTPAKVQAIRGCNQTFDMPMPGSPALVIPLVPIWTGWFLPSKPGMTDEECDGRRVVAIPGGGEGCTLEFRKWKHTRLPISFLRIERSPAGLWGIGAAERLAGFQYRLNELNFLITEAARMGSTGKWVVPTQASVNDDEFTDEQGTVVHYTGQTPPQWVANDGIPKDLLKERDTTYAQALKERGLSEWTVGGVQPENIESGEGLRQLRDQEQGRAVPAGQSWEASHCDLAECVVLAAMDAAEIRAKKGKDGGKLNLWVKDPDGDGLRLIEWERIARLLQDPDARLISNYPTSILPNQPAARFEKLREWLADGTIDQATFAALSEMPDINSEASLNLEGVKSVRKAIGEIVRKGPDAYEPPDPAMPLQYGIKLAQRARLRGIRQGMDEERLVALQNWAEDANNLLMKKPAVPPPDVPAVPPGPPAPGGGQPAMDPAMAAPPPPADLAAAPPPEQMPVAA